MNPVVAEWQPIEDLPENWQSLTRKDLNALADAWKNHSEKLKQSAAYQTFMERLRRKIAIETGVIERLYTIDRGTTQLLIERGLDEALIAHGTTEQLPTRVIALLRDHEAGIESVFDFIQQRRPLSTSYIKELHALLTQHQEYVEAKDQFGDLVQRPLLRGDWKKYPNNPQRPDGEIHFYCPPEQTASQMDQLIAWYNQHTNQEVPPEIEAAWLHHRFTQIHPFQDGNGRVVRLLATLVFLRAGWFPLVITRDERGNYIQALETADQGDLKPLVDLLARVQSQEFDKALSLSEETLSEAPFREMLTEYADTLRRKREAQIQAQQGERRQTEERATTLFKIADERFHAVAIEWESALKPGLERLRVYAKKSSQSDTHYYYSQIVETAKQQGYFANLSESAYKRWVHLLINVDADVTTGILLSFHGFGHEYRGVLVCAACAYRKVENEGSPQVQDIEALSLDPFRITLNEDFAELQNRFRDWLEDILSAGFAYWVNSQG
ncbi:MAG: Fic family protein [Aggregatilineales bacterium]